MWGSGAEAMGAACLQVVEERQAEEACEGRDAREDKDAAQDPRRDLLRDLLIR